MTIEHLIAFNIALLAAVVAPGPALLLAVRTSLARGRAAGVATGSGLALMAAAWTLMALLGVEAIFELFPRAYVAAKILGAGYLVYVALRIWVNARAPYDQQLLPARHAFRAGFLVNLLNPKSVLFAAAVLIVIFPAEMRMTDNVVVVLNHFVIELIFYSSVAAAMSSSGVAMRYQRLRVVVDRVASLVLGALGFRLLFSR